MPVQLSRFFRHADGIGRDAEALRTGEAQHAVDVRPFVQRGVVIETGGDRLRELAFAGQSLLHHKRDEG